MKKLDRKNQRDVQARATLRALRLQELLFGGGASAPADLPRSTPLGTSLPTGAGVNDLKYPDAAGELWRGLRRSISCLPGGIKMKKLDHKNQRDVQARAALRALRLQELLFGRGASASAGSTRSAALGTSIPMGAGVNEVKYPVEAGE